MDLQKNVQSIRERVAAACGRAGRDPAAVTLMAVSKGQPPEAVKAGAEAGLVLFGESKVQEAKAKIPLCPGHLCWHLIGHLQSNKCRDAVALFQTIQGVDSVVLATEINKWADKSGKTMPVLLEVNVAVESSKFGFRPDAVLLALPEINRLSRLEIQGLMCIAPWAPDPEKARPFFRRLRELQSQAQQMLGAPLPQLSMGMSGDFEVAIEEGSTLVRVGTSLFGPRPRPTRETDAP